MQRVGWFAALGACILMTIGCASTDRTSTQDLVAKGLIPPDARLMAEGFGHRIPMDGLTFVAPADGRTWLIGADRLITNFPVAAGDRVRFTPAPGTPTSVALYVNDEQLHTASGTPIDRRMYFVADEDG